MIDMIREIEAYILRQELETGSVPTIDELVKKFNITDEIITIEELTGILVLPDDIEVMLNDEDEENALSLQRATRALEAYRHAEDEVYEQHKDFYNPYGLDTDDNWRSE